MGVEHWIGEIRQQFCLIFVDILTNTVSEAKIQITLVSRVDTYSDTGFLRFEGLLWIANQRVFAQ